MQRLLNQRARLVGLSRVKCPLPDIELASTVKRAQPVKMSDKPSSMDRFVSGENVKRYRRLASESIDAVERVRILKLLADEEAKFKLELGRSDGAREGRSPANAATENRGEHDGEEQKRGG
jgi:hypothetical protein